MSTHSFISARRRHKRLLNLSVCSAFGGLWLALLLSLSSFFSSSAWAARHDPLPSDPPENVARAGVSVVRLHLTYGPKNSEGNTPAIAGQCTGLGIVVKNWKARTASEQNLWLVTDGNLVNSGDGTNCASVQGQTVLFSLRVLWNTAYSPASTTLTLNGTPEQLQKAVHCSAQPCNEGIALLSLHSEEPVLPVIEMAAEESAPKTGIGLGRDALSPDLPASTGGIEPTYLNDISRFLTPSRVANGEAGMPLVNERGRLLSLLLSNKNEIKPDVIQKLLNERPELKNAPANSVDEAWDRGITSYYADRFSDAQKAFQQAATLNSEFRGALDFERKAKDRSTGTGIGKSQGGGALPTPAATPTPNASWWSPLSGGSIYGIQTWLIGVVFLILLAATLVIVSLVFGRRRVLRKRALDEEFAEAERQASVEAQRIAEIEARQQQAWLQPTAPIQQSGPMPVASAMAGQEIPCPHCGKPVARRAVTCPHCQQVLSPSESGLHFRIPAHLQNTLPNRPVGSVADQPTIVPGTEQPTLVPASSLLEQPTVEMLPAPGRSVNGQADADRTMPYGKSRINNPNLNLQIAVRSDPGLKRKYKPNEDSIFAARTVRHTNSSLLQMGLFVVADGMGGHANGQDASRRAIQTIVDFMLPKLIKSNDLQDESLQRLLKESVEHANQAVHQNNMEKRADMGTTVTATLVVNSMAYVSNVGDSRTYIYRTGEKLRKITSDHSVVASLVEAGIIKEDDIYTHPKRNQIYRSLGEKPIVEVDTFMEQLRPGDKLLLCSDGLWDMVRDPKLEDVIKGTITDIEKMADSLIQAAYEGGGEDNVSVVLVSVTEGKPQEPSATWDILAIPEGVQVPQI
jgi:serine/threonine protein phosphatase PrpC